MKTKETVEKLLIKSPHLKDSDAKLQATYWYKELIHNKLDPEKTSAMEFLRLFSLSKVTNPETIRRMRAKLQEEKPELRGESYKLRNEKLQKKWRKDLGYENNQ